MPKKLTLEEIEKRMTETKLCAHCNKPMKAWIHTNSGKYLCWRNAGPYCSVFCGNAKRLSSEEIERRLAETKLCESCGKTMTVWRVSHSSSCQNQTLFKRRGSTCSQLCTSINRIDIPNRGKHYSERYSNCLNCNKEFLEYLPPKTTSTGKHKGWLRQTTSYCSVFCARWHSQMLGRYEQCGVHLRDPLNKEKAVKGRAHRSFRVTIFDETKFISEWVRDQRCKIGGEKLQKTLYARIFRCGWEPEKALTTPVSKKRSEEVKKGWEKRIQRIREEDERAEAFGNIVVDTLRDSMQKLITA